MHYILGAPGAGKTAIIAPLKHLLADWIILDWDAFMEPAAILAGRSIRQNEALWQPYADLVRSVVSLVPPSRLLLLGVCTPEELAGWPEGQWTLLDCADEERTRRLVARGETNETIRTALHDAAEYRTLGLPIIETTGQPLNRIAERIARSIGSA